MNGTDEKPCTWRKDYVRESSGPTNTPRRLLSTIGGRLSEDNRWVQLAYLIPWRRVEQEYSKHFSKDLRGGRAMSVRMALGALIIQEREGFSDRHLVQHITENPYLQYFLGLQAYQEEPPFNPSLLTFANGWVLMPLTK